jgi:hypothetical protein
VQIHKTRENNFGNHKKNNMLILNIVTGIYELGFGICCLGFGGYGTEWHEVPQR